MKYRIINFMHKKAGEGQPGINRIYKAGGISLVVIITNCIHERF